MPSLAAGGKVANAKLSTELWESGPVVTDQCIGGRLTSGLGKHGVASTGRTIAGAVYGRDHDHVASGIERDSLKADGEEASSSVHIDGRKR